MNKYLFTVFWSFGCGDGEPNTAGAPGRDLGLDYDSLKGKRSSNKQWIGCRRLWHGLLNGRDGQSKGGKDIKFDLRVGGHQGIIQAHVILRGKEIQNLHIALATCPLDGTWAQSQFCALFLRQPGCLIANTCSSLATWP